MPLPIVLIVILLAGIALSTQAPLNAALARVLGTPLAAAAVSFGVGFAALAAVTLAVAGPGAFARAGQVPAWAWAGGLLGAFYVWAVVWGVPQAGVLTTVAALILGQMIGALVLDATGAFGQAVQPISPTRLGAAALVAGGVVLSRVSA